MPEYPVRAPGVGDFREAGREPADDWRADARGDRLVPTHCCFCGVQCGMYLRVDRNGTLVDHVVTPLAGWGLDPGVVGAAADETGFGVLGTEWTGPTSRGFYGRPVFFRFRVVH